MGPGISEELKVGESEDFCGKVLGIYMFRGDRLCCRLLHSSSLDNEDFCFDGTIAKKLQRRSLSQKNSRFH